MKAVSFKISHRLCEITYRGVDINENYYSNEAVSTQSLELSQIEQFWTKRTFKHGY